MFNPTIEGGMRDVGFARESFARILDISIVEVPCEEANIFVPEAVVFEVR